MNRNDLEPLLTDAAGVAKMMGVSIQTVRRMDQRGNLPLPLQPTGTRNRRWRIDEMRRWIDAGCPGRTRWEGVKANR